jgi:uncharacterized protein with NRDE domain
MCLIVFASDCHPQYRLILAANRDEYLARPALPADFWADSPQVLAGRDLQAGGTWLGITRGGRIAVITNYRGSLRTLPDPPSRGGLVAGFLQANDVTPEEYHNELAMNGDRYEGFNLLYGRADNLHYFTNSGTTSGRVGAGIHALSNHLLDSGWPKADVAAARLKEIISAPQIDPEQIFTALYDSSRFPDEQLPDTGVGLELERDLSPLFIRGEVYGTRSTSVLLISRTGEVTFSERSFDAAAAPLATRNFTFQITTSD